MLPTNFRVAILLALVCGFLAAAGLSAQQAGKSLRRESRWRIFIAARRSESSLAPEPGGTYDIYSRLMAKHMPRFIPGNPTCWSYRERAPAD